MTGARVIGAAQDAARLPALSDAAAPGDRFPLGIQTVEVIDVPGHTLGHVAYYLAEAAAVLGRQPDELGLRAAVRGDARADACHAASSGRAATRNADLLRARIYRGEWPLCAGAGAREPGACGADGGGSGAAGRGKPSLPPTLAQELATNLFLRADDGLRRALGLPEGASALEIFTEARARKDRF